jgi:hypothetical protein
MKVQISLKFNGRGYIANPFWSEISQLIEIQKKSGFNRAKNDDKRRKTLLAYLEKVGLSEAQYAELQSRAARRFYTNANGEIVIPEDKFLAFLRSVAHEAPSSVRALAPSQVNTAISATDLQTGKKQADGVFSRFVKNEETNERRRQEDPYISEFTARGLLTIDESTVSPEALRGMVEWGGKYKGIGAARPLGYGRFQVVQFEAS